MSCGDHPLFNFNEIDGLFSFICATKNIWGAEKEAGAISVYVMDAIHTILLVRAFSNANLRWSRVMCLVYYRG